MESSTGIQRTTSVVLLCVFVWYATGCAAIVNGSKETVRFTSRPEGAAFQAGSMVGTTPTSMELKRDQNYFVKFTKECHQDAYMPIDKELSGWFWAGLIFFGFFEFISMASGGAYELSPTDVAVDLQPDTTKCPIEAQAMPLQAAPQPVAP